ncbi:phage major capsid protein [Nocardia arthritidis]|uniref:phage major capsid protein n=1 Tax=Nocardia arthritidis TaxID=228602 RepID=UPI00142DEBD2|nr:phage major capsid protein [Nocardia arthritidis]
MPTIDRSALGGNSTALLPDDAAAEIIALAPQSSAVMTLGKRVPMNAQKLNQAVLSAEPVASWVEADTDARPVSTATVRNEVLTAKELETTLVIPRNVYDDASIDLWEQLKPRMAAALGKKLDQAALFGLGSPKDFPVGGIAGLADSKVVGGTGADKDKKTHVVDDPKMDLAAKVAKAGEILASEGLELNGIAAVPGAQWRLIGLRDNNGQPIYTPSLSAGAPAGLYGLPLQEAKNGGWNPAADIVLIAADWSKILVGVRNDVTIEMSDQGTITIDGKPVSLWETRQIAVRVLFRVGLHIAQPVTPVDSKTETQRLAFPGVNIK